MASRDRYRLQLNVTSTEYFFLRNYHLRRFSAVDLCCCQTETKNCFSHTAFQFERLPTPQKLSNLHCNRKFVFCDVFDAIVHTNQWKAFRLYPWLLCHDKRRCEISTKVTRSSFLTGVYRVVQFDVGRRLWMALIGRKSTPMSVEVLALKDIHFFFRRYWIGFRTCCWEDGWKMTTRLVFWRVLIADATAAELRTSNKCLYFLFRILNQFILASWVSAGDVVRWW